MLCPPPRIATPARGGRRPLATVAIGGLPAATRLTLFVLPAPYARLASEEATP